MKRTFATVLMTLTLLCGFALWHQTSRPVAAQATVTIIYVVPGGTGDGSSWDSGQDLATALAAATPGSELWVKSGNYLPSRAGLADPQDAVFTLKNGVALYGGFAGTETERSQRNPDPDSNGTVLNADFDGDDIEVIQSGRPIFSTAYQANSHRVVTGSGTDHTAVLDGFTIRGAFGGDGAAMVNDAGSPTLANLQFRFNLQGGMDNRNNSNPTLTNVTFRYNLAAAGAGMFNNRSHPRLTKVTFEGNYTGLAGSGGGMVNFASSPTLTDVVFRNNSAWEGAGMYNAFGSSPTLINVIFSGNYTINPHPAVIVGTLFRPLGGGIYNRDSSPTLINVIFSGNVARLGSGVFNTGNSSPILTQVTFSGNYARDGSTFEAGLGYTFAGEDTSGLPATLRNCIFWGNTGGEIGVHRWRTVTGGDLPIVSHSIVPGGYAGTGNLDVDPQFVRNVPPLPFALPVLDAGDLRLQATSPAIDAGDNSVANPALPATDLDGNPRIRSGTVDMGAYEFQPANTAPTISGASVTGIAGAAARATIATVNDAEDAVTTLTVTATRVSGSGVTLNGLSVSASGDVTANVMATCTATTSAFTLRATDSGMLSATATLTVHVVDTTAPTLTVQPNLTLWPPNHRYHTVTMAQMVLGVSDDCSTTLGSGDVVIEKVTSDEPDDVAGDDDGITTNDIVIGANCTSVQLRAERNLTLNGRVYVITLRVSDASGNTTRKDVQVSVPIAQRGTAAVQDATAHTRTSDCP